MKFFILVTSLIFTTSCATSKSVEVVNLKNERSISTSDKSFTYKLVVTGGNTVKCAATLGFSAASLIAMGAGQTVSAVIDLIQSTSKKEVHITTSKCMAFQNKNILQGLINAGCIVPVDEVSLEIDMNKYVEDLLKPEDCK